MANNINNTSHTVSEQLLQVDIWRAVPLSVILMLIDLATIVGNLVVILAVVYDYSLRNMATNFYIVSLAVADLMLGLFVLPFSATYEILGYWIFGKYCCVIWAMADVLCCTASILSLVAISLDRYVAISKPMKYPRFSTSKVAGLSIFGVWFLATAVSIPPLFGWRRERTDNYSQCELTSGKGYVTYSALGSFYIPSMVLIFVYSRIYVVAAKHTKDIKKSHALGELRTPDFDMDAGKEPAPSQLFSVKTDYRPSNVSSASQEPFLMDHKHRQRETLAKRLKKFTKEKRAAKTLAIVVGAFLICWSPFFLVYLIGGVCDSCDVPGFIFKTFFWLGYCNSFLNPIIYPCLNKDFRRAFKRIFQRTYCNRSSLDFYDSPRRSMRVIRASRKLRMSMPDSRSSSSPPDSPNLALARRQSIFKEMQIRRASANILNSIEKQDNATPLNCSNCQPVEHFPLSQVEIYDTSPRRPSMSTKIFNYSPPVRRTCVTQETFKECVEEDNTISGSIVSINGNTHYHFPFYNSYFHSEPHICDIGLATEISDKTHLTKRLSKQVQSEDELNLSLLDIPHISDGEMSRPASHHNFNTVIAKNSDEKNNGFLYSVTETRNSLDATDTYFWDCIARLRRKSAEARATQKLGLCRVSSCEYELSQQHDSFARDLKNRSPFFLSLCQLDLPDCDLVRPITHLPLPLSADKSVQTMLTNQHFHKGQASLNCHHCDIK